MLLCQGAGVAVAGLYPLLFPSNGYRGQLRWLGECAAAIGPEAYSLLLASTKEGQIVLPKYLTLRLSNGQMLHIGPNLTVPGSERLARMPSVSVSQTGSHSVINHSQAPCVRDLEMTEEGEECESETAENILVAVKEKEEEVKVLKNTSKQLKVELSHPGVKDTELLAHFSNFGDVESISSSDLSALITFARPGVVEHLHGHDHHLKSEGERDGGGYVRLRMRGGDERSAAPPRSLQRNVNPFRFDIHIFSQYMFSFYRHPHHFNGEALYHLIRWTPLQFQQYCAATAEATPPRSSLSHESRVFAWRFKLVAF